MSGSQEILVNVNFGIFLAFVDTKLQASTYSSHTMTVGWQFECQPVHSAE